MQGMPYIDDFHVSHFTFHHSPRFTFPLQSLSGKYLRLCIFAPDCKSFISLCSSDCILQKARTKAEPIIDLLYPNLHCPLILLQHQAFVTVTSGA